jgi:hypothetical protein
MTPASSISVMAAALRDAFPVSPWLAALWLLSAIALAGLLVGAWRRLLRP